MSRSDMPLAEALNRATALRRAEADELLTAAQARRMRWHAQLLGGSSLTPAEVVRRAVALQGQDLPGVLRAIAIRSRAGTTLADVRAAFAAGELVRSWPMRGTLFATTPEQLAALLHFTGERLHRAAARRRTDLGLDDRVVDAAREVLLDGLGSRPLTRAEVLASWEDAGIGTTEGRGYHLIAHFAIAGLVHWGAFAGSGSEQLLTLSPANVPADPDAALAAVVRGYVSARGPVSESDLAWWTKLPLGVLRRAVASVDDVVTVSVDGAPAWMIGEPAPAAASGVTLIPAFDEWILGYADRSLVASPRMLEALVPGNNGVFRPGILVDGVVVGTWRMPRGKAPVIELVEPVPARTRRAIDAAISDWPHAAD
ncbi:winged helix DNA-binding domain-containing protein [Salinibacterium sp. dk2585]|uniref:DNA glycosylase AlkZ-like family protein n=1 Tax=unclassified Salinibacterium TaxID=2632331 RepID=UPI0011C24D7A|nr:MULTISPECIES: crosslink repair DNA glycosylase YcaQ family protein [unclassified Salinibacterium]QEE61035.1 winged helix DNA-binding domain-containing protein [Salinibacterium sp. dk2585]TXK52977.1 winged helix DNA-binding domain-containing protein [Salinibacterium sp. dk5596]